MAASESEQEQRADSIRIAVLVAAPVPAELCPYHKREDAA
jgi:hypothetical protein